MGYLFTTSKTPYIENGTIEDASWRKIVKLWTNFAKYGNPTPNKEQFETIWQPVKIPGEIVTMNIGYELEMEINPNEETIRFWKEIFKECPNTINML